MFRRSVPAALFIDFDNIERYGLAEKIANWTAWLEDGQFDERGRRRKLIQKRIYWNSQFEGYRDAFETAGYEAIMCPSRVRRGKSAADMIMALDAYEVATQDKSVNEFILLTTDSDFIPLFERLTGLSKSTVTLADPDQRFVYATYSDHADIVIPTFRIMEAGDYRREPFHLSHIWRRRKPQRRVPVAPPDSHQHSPKQSLRAATPDSSKRVANFELGAQVVAALAKQNSGSFISKRTITRTLERKFGSMQSNRWFGCGSYKAFINKAAGIRPDLSVRPAKGGGISVRFRAAKAHKSEA